MATPFYSVKVVDTGRDISDWISQVRYEDTVDQDDLLVLAMDTVPLERLEGEDLRRGNEVQFFFGTREGNQSPIRYAEIKKVEPVYAKQISATVTCFDKGFPLKRETDKRFFEGKTASQIVSEIADEFKLEKVIDQTTKVYDCMPQANKTYHDFISHLAAKEGAEDDAKGPVRFFVRGRTLYFTRRDLSRNSFKSFFYGDGNGPVKSFRPKLDTDKDGASNVIKSDYVVPNDVSEEESETNTQETGLGEEMINYDVNAEKLERTGGGRSVYRPETEEEDVKRQTRAIRQDRALAQFTATLDLDLDPMIEADQIITIGGVAKQHLGNWYLTKVTHTVVKGNASTVCQMSKNAAAKGVKKAETSNKTVGQETDTKRSVKEFIYNEDGNLKNVDESS